MSNEEVAYTGYNHDLLERSRELRRKMTRQERRLWYEFLRGYPVKIYRQRSIDCFIVDFYCSAARLVIEVDGGQHFTPEGQDYDQRRTQVLAAYGVRVLRFSNREVDREFPAVCQIIDKTIQARLGAESLLERDTPALP